MLSISSIGWRSIEESPLKALTTIGAKVIAATTAILEGWPKPSQSTAIGEMAMIGIELSEAAIGSAPRRRKGRLTNRQAQAKPSALPSSRARTASEPG